MKVALLTGAILIAIMLFITSQIDYIPYLHSRQGLPNKYNYGTE